MPKFLTKVVAGALLLSLVWTSVALGWEVNYPSVYGGPGGNLATYLVYLYYLILSLGGLATVVMLIIGGVRYMSSAMDVNERAAAKKMITNAVIGLVILLSSYVILNTISPGLTMLSLPGLKEAKMEDMPTISAKARYVSHKINTNNNKVKESMNKNKYFLQSVNPSEDTPYSGPYAGKTLYQQGNMNTRSTEEVVTGGFIEGKSGSPYEEVDGGIKILNVTSKWELKEKRNDEDEIIPPSEVYQDLKKSNKKANTKWKRIETHQSLNYSEEIGGYIGKIKTQKDLTKTSVPVLLTIESKGEQKEQYKVNGQNEERQTNVVEALEVLRVGGRDAPETEGEWDRLQEDLTLSDKDLNTLKNFVQGIPGKEFLSRKGLKTLAKELRDNPNQVNKLRNTIKKDSKGLKKDTQGQKENCEEFENNAKETTRTLNTFMARYPKFKNAMVAKGKQTDDVKDLQENLQDLNTLSQEFSQNFAVQQGKLSGIFSTLNNSALAKANTDSKIREEIKKVKDEDVKDKTYDELVRNSFSSYSKTSHKLTQISKHSTNAKNLLRNALDQTRTVKKKADILRQKQELLAQVSGERKKQVKSSATEMVEEINKILEDIKGEVSKANDKLESINQFLEMLSGDLRALLRDLRELARKSCLEGAKKAFGVAGAMMRLVGDLAVFGTKYGIFDCNPSDIRDLTRPYKELGPMFEFLVNFSKEMVKFDENIKDLTREVRNFANNLQETADKLNTVADIIDKMANIFANMDFKFLGFGGSIMSGIALALSVISSVCKSVARAVQIVHDHIAEPFKKVMVKFQKDVESWCRIFHVLAQGMKPIYEILAEVTVAVADYYEDFYETPSRVYGLGFHIKYQYYKNRIFYDKYKLALIKKELKDEHPGWWASTAESVYDTSWSLAGTVDGSVENNKSYADIQSDLDQFEGKIAELIEKAGKKYEKVKAARDYALSEEIRYMGNSIEYMGEKIVQACSGGEGAGEEKLGEIFSKANTQDLLGSLSSSPQIAEAADANPNNVGGTMGTMSQSRSREIDEAKEKDGISDKASMTAKARAEIETEMKEGGRSTRGTGTIELYTGQNCKGRHAEAGTRGKRVLTPVDEKAPLDPATYPEDKIESLKFRGEGIYRVCDKTHFSPYQESIPGIPGGGNNPVSNQKMFYPDNITEGSGNTDYDYELNTDDILYVPKMNSPRVFSNVEAGGDNGPAHVYYPEDQDEIRNFNKVYPIAYPKDKAGGNFVYVSIFFDSGDLEYDRYNGNEPVIGQFHDEGNTYPMVYPVNADDAGEQEARILYPQGETQADNSDVVKAPEWKGNTDNLDPGSDSPQIYAEISGTGTTTVSSASLTKDWCRLYKVECPDEGACNAEVILEPENPANKGSKNGTYDKICLNKELQSDCNIYDTGGKNVKRLYKSEDKRDTQRKLFDASTTTPSGSEMKLYEEVCGPMGIDCAYYEKICSNADSNSYCKFVKDGGGLTNKLDRTKKNVRVWYKKTWNGGGNDQQICDMNDCTSQSEKPGSDYEKRCNADGKDCEWCPSEDCESVPAEVTANDDGIWYFYHKEEEEVGMKKAYDANGDPLSSPKICNFSKCEATDPGSGYNKRCEGGGEPNCQWCNADQCKNTPAGWEDEYGVRKEGVHKMETLHQITQDSQCINIPAQTLQSARTEASLKTPTVLFRQKNYEGASETFALGSTSRMGEVGPSASSIYVGDGIWTVLCRRKFGDCGPRYAGEIEIGKYNIENQGQGMCSDYKYKISLNQCAKPHPITYRLNKNKVEESASDPHKECADGKFAYATAVAPDQGKFEKLLYDIHKKYNGIKYSPIVGLPIDVIGWLFGWDDCPDYKIEMYCAKPFRGAKHLNESSTDCGDEKAYLMGIDINTDDPDYPWDSCDVNMSGVCAKMSFPTKMQNPPGEVINYNENGFYSFGFANSYSNFSNDDWYSFEYVQRVHATKKDEKNCNGVFLGHHNLYCPEGQNCSNANYMVTDERGNLYTFYPREAKLSLNGDESARGVPTAETSILSAGNKCLTLIWDKASPAALDRRLATYHMDACCGEWGHIVPGLDWIYSTNNNNSIQLPPSNHIEGPLPPKCKDPYTSSNDDSSLFENNAKFIEVY